MLRMQGPPRLDRFDTILPETAAAKAEFAASHSLVWRKAFEGGLLEQLLAACDRARFVSDMVGGLGHREIEHASHAGEAVRLALTRALLLRWLETVTGCGPISAVDGRIVQTQPCAGDELDWHDDVDGSATRRLGITVALGRHGYGGGEFEMRAVGSDSPPFRWKHDEPGTALIFEVSPHYEHRVRPLTSGGPRRVFTGWFIG